MIIRERGGGERKRERESERERERERDTYHNITCLYTLLYGAIQMNNLFLIAILFNRMKSAEQQRTILIIIIISFLCCTIFGKMM